MPAESKQLHKKRFEIPHVYTIALLLIILFAILTWIIPSGEFDRTIVSTAAGDREVAVAGSYHGVPKVDSQGNDLRQGIPQVLMAPTRGIQAACDVVAFVLLVGGTFAIINKTNAINAGMSRVIKRIRGKDIWIIPIVMILFGIGGTTFGMCEEVLPFYGIFMPIMMGLGYDSMTAFLVVFMGSQLGYAASTTNPFNVLISQGIAGIQGNPQLWFRAIQWVIFMAVGIAWVMMYARKVKRNPQSSITYRDDIAKRGEFSVHTEELDVPFTSRQKLVLCIFAGGMCVVVWGLVTRGWYMDEISMVFLAMGLLAGFASGMPEKEIAEEFVFGMKDFAFAAIIIGIARGILVIAQGGMIIDTILNFLANLLAGVPMGIYTTMMFLVHALLTPLIPSSSGLASITIPIMAPLTDLMGVNPEAAVTAMQYGNHLMNAVNPTSGVLVAGLALCKIPLQQWWRTIWKFLLVLSAISLVFCAISGMLPA